MDSIISLRNVTKSFSKKEKPVLKNISLDLSSGQIVGLFGKVNSGKSTLLRLLSGLIPDFEGQLIIDGHEISKYTKSIVSYLPETMVFPKKATIEEIILFYKSFYRDFNPIVTDGILFKFQMKKNLVYNTLTEDQKKLVNLALVLSREAKVYLLDEPLSNEKMEQNWREFIFDTIFHTCAKNSLILISSRFMEDIEDSCDTVIFFEEGQIKLFGERKQLVKDYDKSISLIFKEVCSK